MRALLSALASVALSPLIASQVQAADIVLFDGQAAPTIVHDDTHAAPLGKAADLLARDLMALSGHRPVIRTDSKADGPEIIFGLVSSPSIAHLLQANGIDAGPLKGQWETYGRAAIHLPGPGHHEALLIFGSDVRGTIWGVMDLSREMGVSPWEWWADVTIRHKDRLVVDGALRFSRTPSVKYRAIFLNDEEFGLWPWAANTYDPKLHDLGPRTYERIYELMWRLKANTVWPGMRGIEKSFNQIPGNAEMAASYAIVRASSHVEMMTRTNIREWDAKKLGDYNYLTNRDAVLHYWDEAVAKAQPFETMYTMGMRGIEDRPMQGAATPQEQARVLERVFADQQAMLHRRLGQNSEIPQVFTPYKEVLPAYDAGLKVPPDITLTWPDDNYGYIRRLSDGDERTRPGGSGIYYHISYWGYPMSYLWLANTHPALIWEEMNKAYHFDARRLWVLNVGDIKPGEYLTQLFLDLAFDNQAFPDIASVRTHLRRWAAENFGEADADRIATLLWEQYDLAFDRNPEMMAWTKTMPPTSIAHTAFNSLSFGDENARRLASYAALHDEADSIGATMPEDRRDAFYELVGFPIAMADAMNRRQLNLDKTMDYALQHRASANAYAEHVRDAQATIDAGGKAYNDRIASGKWRDMMGMAPHGLTVYQPPLTPTWAGPQDKGCMVQLEGGGIYDATGSTPGQSDFMPELLRVHEPPLPPFQPDLRRSRTIDIFLKSPGTARWTATPSAPWIRVDRAGGTLQGAAPEQRVTISVDWATAPQGGKGTVTFDCDDTPAPMAIPVSIAPSQAAPGVSFIESDRLVSMYATHADTIGTGWETLKGLGHTGAVLRTSLDMASINAVDQTTVRQAPSVTFRFSTVTNDDPATLRVTALPFLPVTSRNGMRAAVSVDGGPLKLLDFSAPEFSQRWQEHVLSNSATETVDGLRLAPGAHSVTLYALDPGFALDRLELAFSGAARAYGPVPETRIVELAHSALKL